MAAELPKVKISELATDPAPTLAGIAVPHTRNGQTWKVGGETLADLIINGIDEDVDALRVDVNGIEDRVSTVEANQVTGVKTYESWAALNPVIGAAGDGAEVLPTDAGTHTDPVVGGTVANAGTYIWSASPAGWKWVTAEAFTSKVDKTTFNAFAASASDLAAIRSRSMELSAVVSGGLAVAAGTALSGNYNLSLGYKGWAIGLDAGTDVTVGDYYDAAGFDVALDSAATKLVLNVYERLTAGATPNGLPGHLADSLIMSATYTLAEAGVAPVNTTQRAIFKFPRYLLIEEGKTYILAWEARNASDDIVPSGCGYVVSAGYPQRRIGYTRHLVTEEWEGIATATNGLAWNLLRDNIENIIEDITASRKAVLRMEPETEIKYLRAGTPIFPKSLGFGNWIGGVLVGTDIVAGLVFDVLSMAIDPHVDAANAVVKLWRRSTVSTGFPGTGADTIVDTAVYSVASLGLVAGEFHDATFTFRTAVTAIAGEIYFLEVDLLDAAGDRVAFGVNAITDASYTQAYRRGYYRNGAGTTATVDSGYGVSISLGREVLVSPPAEDTDFSPFDTVIAAGATVDDGALTATVDSELSAIDRRGTKLPFGGTVTFAVPTTGSVVDEAKTISFSNFGYGASGLGGLANGNISNVVVKDAGTLDVLVENTDYIVNYPHGKIVRAAAGADRAVLVSYDWSRRRYDMVVVHPETLAVSVVAGTEANRDAQERLPSRSSADQMPLYMARVTASSIDLVPLWDAEDGRPRKYLPALLREVERGRRHLRPILKKLEAGDPVTIAGYGDSIVGCPGISASPTTPNGTTRDITSMFAGPTGGDLVSALPLYDQGDGGGAIHHHASHIRRAIDALGERYASTIDYLNFGIGGTTSGSTGSNGSEPTRLGALTASAADLVIIGFGMNELGSSGTVANMTTIVQACLDAGKKVIIIGVPRPNAVRTPQDGAWRYTNRALERVARYLDVAFVDFVSLYDDDCLSAMGISKFDVCAANYYNHPSINEYRIMGAVIARLLAD